MAEINFKVDVPPNKEAEFFRALAGFFGGTPIPNFVKGGVVNSDPIPVEKATKKEPEAKVEKAVKKKIEEVKEKSSDAPTYSIVSIRAKAKEVAGTKGNDFVRECLESVGASSISTIEEEKYGEFMEALSSQ